MTLYQTLLIYRFIVVFVITILSPLSLSLYRRRYFIAVKFFSSPLLRHNGKQPFIIGRSDERTDVRALRVYITVIIREYSSISSYKGD